MSEETTETISHGFLRMTHWKGGSFPGMTSASTHCIRSEVDIIGSLVPSAQYFIALRFSEDNGHTTQTVMLSPAQAEKVAEQMLKVLGEYRAVSGF